MAVGLELRIVNAQYRLTLYSMLSGAEERERDEKIESYAEISRRRLFNSNPEPDLCWVLDSFTILRQLRNTIRYTHLANAIANNEEAYVCKVANDTTEASDLIESGFEYVTTFDNIMLFRKRK